MRLFRLTDMVSACFHILGNDHNLKMHISKCRYPRRVKMELHIMINTGLPQHNTHKKPEVRVEKCTAQYYQDKNKYCHTFRGKSGNLRQADWW